MATAKIRLDLTTEHVEKALRGIAMTRPHPESTIFDTMVTVARHGCKVEVHAEGNNVFVAVAKGKRAARSMLSPLDMDDPESFAVQSVLMELWKAVDRDTD